MTLKTMTERRRVGEVLIEPIDPGRFWGVFEAEGYSPDPLALFRTRKEANEWLDVMRATGELGNIDYCVCPAWVESGEVANHFDDEKSCTALEASRGGNWRMA